MKCQTISRAAALKMADILDMDLPRLTNGATPQDVSSMSGSPLVFSEDLTVSADGLTFIIREHVFVTGVRQNVHFDGTKKVVTMQAFVSGPGFDRVWIATGEKPELMAWCEAFRRGWRPDHWSCAGVPKAAIKAAGPSTYDARTIANKRRLARKSQKIVA